VRYVISHLIQLCVRFNYLLPILYHITLYNEKLFGASLPSYYFRNVTLIIHNNIYTFYVKLMYIKLQVYCHLWMKSEENFGSYNVLFVEESCSFASVSN